ncbi:ankyrin [Penicillium malachiteum]|nr:ankyrin [Penicillium malachiteum]
MDNPGWDAFKSEIERLERLNFHENRTREELLRVDSANGDAVWRSTLECSTSGGSENTLIPETTNSLPRKWVRGSEKARKARSSSMEFRSTLQRSPNQATERASWLNIRYSSAPSIPEGYVVATPAPPGMRVLWSDSLPWIRFIRFIKPSQIHDVSPSSPGFRALNLSRNDNAVANSINF